MDENHTAAEPTNVLPRQPEIHSISEARLAEVKKAGAGQWEQLRAALESAWRQAEAAFKKLVD